MIHLDTNYVVAAVKLGTPQAAQVDAWELAGEPLRVSAMAWAESLCGPLRPTERAAAAALLGAPEPVTAADAVKAAELFNLAGRRRGSLADCIIAAAALRAGAALATDNRADFAPFAAVGLRVVP
jgi:predicted nucleic acid-binding protein